MDNFLSHDCFSVDFELVKFESSSYFVPSYAKDRPACQAILRGEYYEPGTHFLIALLMAETPGNLIHAGTFFGDMLPSFSRKCPKIVYAFEPVLENYILARLCVQQNGIGNVALFNSGLGEITEIAYADTRDDNNSLHRGGASRIAEAGQVTTITTIDSLSISDLSVIQLDVEGFELPALKGARSTIGRNRPTILIEDNKGECGPFLTSLDYVCIGAIPGLEVWCDDRKTAVVESFVARVNG